MVEFVFGFFVGLGISNEINSQKQFQTIPTVNVVVECKHDVKETKTTTENLNLNNGESFKEYIERLKKQWKLI